MCRENRNGDEIARVILEPDIVVEVSEEEYRELHIIPSYDKLPSFEEFSKSNGTLGSPKSRGGR